MCRYAYTETIWSSTLFYGIVKPEKGNRKSLLPADQLGCKSIAFPLIATGVYGFPKDKALDIALSVIRQHLEDSDLNVTLVVFGRSSYQIASGLTEQIEEYIDENYAAGQIAAERAYCLKQCEGAGSPFGEPKADRSLEYAVNNLGESFRKRLLRMIGERGMTDPEVYKRAIASAGLTLTNNTDVLPVMGVCVVLMIIDSSDVYRAPGQCP